MHEPSTEADLSDKILTIRGLKVILDFDLAVIYGVETRVLKQSVRRNMEKFPADFMFSLTQDEVRSFMDSRSQTVILNQGQNIKYLPFAFTEHGALMAANVLRSRRAVEMSVFVIRAFIRMRQAMLTRHEMEKRLDQIEKILLVHDDSLKELYERIRPLLLPAPDEPKPRIGFHARANHGAAEVEP